MKEVLEKIANNGNFKLEKFSDDIQQVSPELRVHAISNIVSALDIPSDSSIIDIGTGYGYGAVLLNVLGNNVIGLEIFDKKLENGIKYWEKQGIKIEKNYDLEKAVFTNNKLYFANMDSRKINHFPDSSVDFVTSFYLSAYMLGKNGAYQNVHKVLKPNGKLILSTEGVLNVPEFARGLLVKTLGKRIVPKGLKFEKMITMDKNKAYDRYVIIYKK